MKGPWKPEAREKEVERRGLGNLKPGRRRLKEGALET
jgi:hypothetical protein